MRIRRYVIPAKAGIQSFNFVYTGSAQDGTGSRTKSGMTNKVLNNYMNTLLKLKRFIPQLFVVLVVVYLFFLIRPAILGQLGGTFQPHKVPSSYVQLEQFLNKQQQFSRTLWVPVPQRFGFYSYQHPAVSAEDYFHVASVSGVLDMLQKPSAEKELQDAGVQYVIVPYDSEGEIFLKDRKYNENLYQSTVQHVQNISWLKPLPKMGKIALFEVPNPKDHFFLAGAGKVSYTFINPTEYKVVVEGATKGERLVFSESYDKFWEATLRLAPLAQGKNISSQLYADQLNSFILPQNGSYTMTVFYQPQQWVNIGLYISGATMIILAGYGVWILFDSKRKR